MCGNYIIGGRKASALKKNAANLSEVFLKLQFTE